MQINLNKATVSKKHTIVDRNTDSFNAGSREQLKQVVRNYFANKAAMDKNVKIQNEAPAEKASITDKAADIASAIYETVLKSGIARKSLKYCPFVAGSNLRIDVKYNSSYGVAAIGPETVQPVYLADKQFFPVPTTISHNLMIDGVELRTSSGDILAEKEEEGKNAIRVKEDRLFKKGLDTALTLAPASHSVVAVGKLSPNILAGLATKPSAYGLAVARYLMASDVTEGLLGSNFEGWFSQYDKYTINSTGTIGQLLGAEVDTDAYLDPALKVLKSGEIYALTKPENLGGISDMAEVEAKPVDGAYRGVNGQGLFVSEIIGMLVYNYKGIAKAQLVGAN